MITLALLFALYFLPTVVASQRGHRVGVLLMLNLFFGWTVVGWVMLLLYVLLSPPRLYMAVPPAYAQVQSPGGWQRF